jgi:glycosyltransferase involved in cell wall biosynthesis
VFTSDKIAIVSVINDLVTDHRVKKSCNALTECGFRVILVGRRLPGSLPLPGWNFEAIRMKLLFQKGPLFYFFFNLRLFFLLLFKKCNLLYANDLDTLLPNFLVSKIRRIPLIYDSHELFCEVPELQKTPFKKRIWESLESFLIPKLKTCITVNESIAKIFEEKYNIAFKVIRNIPDKEVNVILKSRSELGLPDSRKIILLQGTGINIDRGAEELVEAMKQVDGLLLIIGSGDVWGILEKKIRELKLEDKVGLISRIPKSELMSYTCNADIGISIDKPTNLNYYNSLPNKLFDYIHAGVPILASRLPEIEKIITQYKVGEFIDGHAPEKISGRINEMLQSPQLSLYRENCIHASKVLNWASEADKLKDIILRATRE